MEWVIAFNALLIKVGLQLKSDLPKNFNHSTRLSNKPCLKIFKGRLRSPFYMDLFWGHLMDVKQKIQFHLNQMPLWNRYCMQRWWISLYIWCIWLLIICFGQLGVFFGNVEAFTSLVVELLWLFFASFITLFSIVIILQVANNDTWLSTI